MTMFVPVVMALIIAATVLIIVALMREAWLLELVERRAIREQSKVSTQVQAELNALIERIGDAEVRAYKRVEAVEAALAEKNDAWNAVRRQVEALSEQRKR